MGAIRIETVDIEMCVDRLKDVYTKEADIEKRIKENKQAKIDIMADKSDIDKSVADAVDDVKNNYPHIACYISDHALVRYLEEVHSLNLGKYRQDMIKLIHGVGECAEVHRNNRPTNYNYYKSISKDRTLRLTVVDSTVVTCLIEGKSNEDKKKQTIINLSEDEVV